MANSDLIKYNYENPSTVLQDCFDKHGSRKVQNNFETQGDQQKQSILDQIKDQLIHVIKDIFGNYVVQKMITKGIVLI